MEALLRKGVYTAVCVLLSIMGGKGGQGGATMFPRLIRKNFSMYFFPDCS